MLFVRDMSQVHVERLIGKLITDEVFRVRFHIDPQSMLLAEGLILTDQELVCVLGIDPSTLKQMAACLDPRLVRCCPEFKTS